MAKTGVNIAKCNVYNAEKHNGRDNKYIAAVNASPNKTYSIFSDMTPTNVAWRNPDERYKDKTLVQLLNDIRKEVKEKTGQKLQEKDRIRKVKDKKTGVIREKVIPGSSPIREGVCPIKEDTKIEDFKPVIDWLAARHVQVIRIDIHNDEGHVDVETNERKYNRHAHLIFDWMLHEDVEFVDPKTGKTRTLRAGTSVKLDQKDMSELQTVLAEALGMERGESKEVTGAEHLKVLEYRLQETAKDVERLEKKNEELKKENGNLKEQKREELLNACSDLQTLGRNNVTQFDRTLLLANGAVPPTKQEKEDRDSLERESNRDLSEMTEKELIREGATLHQLIDRTYRAIERFGNKIIEIANNVPKLSLFSSRQRELLAREAEMEQKVADARSEAQKAVEQAKIDQETAIAEAQRIANRKVADAQREAQDAKDAAKAAEMEAKKRSTAALNREQTAQNEAMKYEDFNANFEQKITAAKTAAKQEGYNSGYAAGKAAEKAKTDAKQAEIDQMKATNAEEVENWKKKYEKASNFASFCVKTNPLLQQNLMENIKELNSHKIFKFTPDEVQRLFAGKVVEKTYSEMRNWKEIKIPVNIEIALSDQGNVKVWYNDKSWENCLKELKAQVVELGRDKGRSL